MSKLYITRHGETEWNKERRIQGQLNSPLSALGREQAEWLAKRLEKTSIDVIFSSSLERAMETATIIKKERKIEIIPCEELKEINLGDWQGKLLAEVEELYPQKHFHFWKQPEKYEPISGESFIQLTQRVGTFFEKCLSSNPQKNILFVGHAIVLQALNNYLLNNGDLLKFWESSKMFPASLTTINYENGIIEYEMIGDISHYQEVNEKGTWFVDN